MEKLVNISVNNKTYSVEEGLTIMQTLDNLSCMIFKIKV